MITIQFALHCIIVFVLHSITIAIVTGIVSFLLFIVVCNFNSIYVKGFDNFVRELKCQYKHLKNIISIDIHMQIKNFPKVCNWFRKVPLVSFKLQSVVWVLLTQSDSLLLGVLFSNRNY